MTKPTAKYPSRSTVKALSFEPFVEPVPGADGQFDTPVEQPPAWYMGKQAVGEYEVQGIRDLSGTRHLHFLYQKGRWEWVLRYQKSELCPTTRCRLVFLAEVPLGHRAIEDGICSYPLANRKGGQFEPRFRRDCDICKNMLATFNAGKS